MKTNTNDFYDVQSVCACGAQIHGHYVTMCRVCKTAQARQRDAMYSALDAGHDVIGQTVNDRYHRILASGERSRAKFAQAKRTGAK